MIPPKIRRGHGVRIVAPSRSLGLEWITDDIIARATDRLQSYGLEVSFGDHVRELNAFQSSAIAHRVADLHAAFQDDAVHMILTVTGGFNVNEILPYLDYDLIRAHPKVLCGYSDITALQHALYALTGLVTYAGPHFFDFGEKKHFEYTEQSFRDCVFSTEPLILHPSPSWSDDRWGRDQNNRTLHNNSGWQSIVPGEAKGVIIGSNQVTFHALSNTPYMPTFTEPTVLFLEEDHEQTMYTFARTLTSLTERSDFDRVCGLVFGRFQPESRIDNTLFTEYIRTHPRLRSLPSIANVDFGHTTPRITFPIGGHVDMRVDQQHSIITLTEH